MPVLVLDGHSRAAVETVQSLGRRKLQIDVASEQGDCLSFQSRYACLKLSQPAVSSPREFVTWLKALDVDRNYELIVASTETSLLGLRTMAEDDLLRRKAVLPPNDALDVALDKQKTWVLARELKIPVPDSILLSETIGEADHHQFPLVLKPMRSKVMVEGELQTLPVTFANDRFQLREQLHRWLPVTPVLQQEYVSGRGVGIEFLFAHGKKVWHFAHERLHEFPLSGGASSYRRSIEPPAVLLSQAETMLAALGWHGVAMVEFKVNNDGRHWLMEINPRLWGSLAVGVDAGVDFPFGLLQLARSTDPGPQPIYRTHYYTRDLRTDAHWFKANLLADRGDPLLLTRPRLRSALELFRVLAGVESWDHFDCRDLGVTGRIVSHILPDQLQPVFCRIRRLQMVRRMLRDHGRLLKRLKDGGGIHKVVFLCSGNICRSPLAAALAQTMLPEVEVTSAGFHARPGRPCPEKILQIALESGIDLSEHRSFRLNKQVLRDASLILVMDLDNVTQLAKEMPEALSRTTLLGFFAKPRMREIPDPYAAGFDETSRICKAVRSSVEGLALFVHEIREAAKAMAGPRLTSVSSP